VEAISADNGSVSAKGKEYFVGLPSPAAAGLSVSAVLLHHWLVNNVNGPSIGRFTAMALPPLMLLLGWLMVSRVRYLHMGNWFFSGRRKLVQVFMVVAVLALALRFYELIGFVLFGLYAIGFLVWDLARTVVNARARRRLARAGGPGAPPSPGGG
jgi:phosphatidylserine synthase